MTRNPQPRDGINRSKVYGRQWRNLVQHMLSEDDRCWLCGQPGADTGDHITPVTEGGAWHDPTNVRPAHKSCNSSRGARTAQPRPQSRRW